MPKGGSQMAAPVFAYKKQVSTVILRYNTSYRSFKMYDK